MSMVTDAYLCGWRVRSEVALPELYPWFGEDRPADVSFRLTEPEELQGAIIDHAQVRIVVHGNRCWMDIPSVARFLIRDGVEVQIAPCAEVEASTLRNYLLGTVVGVLCHQRGLYPLHAACLSLGGQACAFSGNSGIGKSTLAAALAARGHVLLSDDLCVLDLSGPVPMVQPAFPRVKLWPRSMQALKIDPEGLHHDGDKHHFRFSDVAHFTPDPVPLHAVYFLRAAQETEPEGITELTTPEALHRLHRQVYRHLIARGMGLSPLLFAQTARLASSLPMRLLSRRMDLDRLPETAALLESFHLQPAEASSE